MALSCGRSAYAATKIARKRLRMPRHGQRQHRTNYVRDAGNRVYVTLSVADFAVDRDGEFRFFERNSAGQWAWMEKADDFIISRFVAEAFAKRLHPK
jgi:hypothetical protein